MAKQIELTQGLFTTVDDEDYEMLSQNNWYAKIDKTAYAARNARGRKVYMHRVILQAPDGLEVDHIDGDGLNNQRLNIRICTHQENIKNRKINGNNTSGFKGVSWDEHMGKWKTTIKANMVKIHLGYHATKEAAARAYNVAARKYHGEFASLNEIGESNA